MIKTSEEARVFLLKSSLHFSEPVILEEHTRQGHKVWSFAAPDRSAKPVITDEGRIRHYTELDDLVFYPGDVASKDDNS